MDVGVRHLRALLAVVQEGSITDAAILLGVSQPAVSRMLRELESHLGVSLVERSTRHLRVTDEGERYRLRAAAAVKALTQALNPTLQPVRPIRVGHAWAAFGVATTSVVTEWRSLHPGSPIELHRFDDRLAGLGADDVDVVVARDLDPDLGAPISRAWVGTERRVVALPAAHALAGRATVAMDDFGGERLIVNTRSGTTTLRLWEEGAPSRPVGIVEVGSTEDWLFAIAAGEGLGITSEATAAVSQSADVVYRSLTGVHDLTVELAWLEPASHPLTPQFVQHVSAVTASTRQR